MARVNGKPLPANYMVQLKVSGIETLNCRWIRHCARRRTRKAESATPKLKVCSENKVFPFKYRVFFIPFPSTVASFVQNLHLQEYPRAAVVLKKTIQDTFCTMYPDLKIFRNFSLFLL
jgi:hypothetical protein